MRNRLDKPIPFKAVEATHVLAELRIEGFNMMTEL
jgi:hypothetical protein